VSIFGRFRRHASSLRRAVSTPSDALLLARMLGWSAVLPLAKRRLPLPRLVRLMHPRRHASRRDPDREAAIASLAAWVFKTRPPGARDNCLERSLVVYRYLLCAGARPELVMGVARGMEEVYGHAWVTLDGRAVHDSPAMLAGFEPICVAKSDGMLVGTPPSDATSFDRPHSLL
jgi:hypothetical protein